MTSDLTSRPVQEAAGGSPAGRGVRRPRSSRWRLHPVVRVLLLRVMQAIPTAMLACFGIFVLIRFLPGGPATALLGTNASEESIAALDERLGLDNPLLVQFADWGFGILQGDFGTSLQNSGAIAPQLVSRLAVSLELVLVALIVSALIAIPLGTWTASRVGTRADSVTLNLSGIGLAIPDFFLAIVFIDFLGSRLGLFPVLGWVPFGVDPGQNLNHLFMPMLTLAAGAASIAARQTRAAMIDALASDYVRTARAMGIPERTVVWRYALRNVLPTIFTVYGLLLISMLGATVILEEIFVLPGLGSSLIIAVNSRDFPMLQGIVLVFVLIVLFISLLVDALNYWVSPRLRKAIGA